MDNLRFRHPLPENGRDGVRLGLFAKAPEPGRVKTRLCPPLSPAEAALLYRAALRETVTAMSAAGLRPVLFYAGDEGFFARRFPGLARVPQGEGDLGRRMERALELLLAGGRGPAALIGSDSPDLPPELVGRALAALRDAEVVTIPARDGGYVLIGESRHHPALFRGIPWSTGGVLAATRQQAAAGGIRYREVGRWEDLDDAAALQRLLQRSPASVTARLARRLLRRSSLPAGLRPATGGPGPGRRAG